jgi:hypothetical protein
MTIILDVSRDLEVISNASETGSLSTNGCKRLRLALYGWLK